MFQKSTLRTALKIAMSKFLILRYTILITKQHEKFL